MFVHVRDKNRGVPMCLRIEDSQGCWSGSGCSVPQQACFENEQRRRGSGGVGYYSALRFYATFFACCALTCAHLARCAAAILRLAPSESLRVTRAKPALPCRAECGSFRSFAHRAFWARAIRLRATADTT